MSPSMEVVIAPDSLKGSCTAFEAADAIERGWRTVFPDANYHKQPMADGGENTAAVLVAATEGSFFERKVCGPLMDPVTARYGILGDKQTAVVEMAEAAGLTLVADAEKDPRITTTFGVGELILDALDRGCRQFIVCIGGSATNDGGAGMLQALGVKFYNNGDQLDLKQGGGELVNLTRIDLAEFDPRIKESSFTVACDVDNPLTGPKGASHIFGGQKGANDEIREFLDGALVQYAKIAKLTLGREIDNVKGAGAAGGLGAGLYGFMDATLEPGADIVARMTGLEELFWTIQRRDVPRVAITAEGKIDSQTAHGKAPYKVAQLALRHGTPTVGLAGQLGDGYQELMQHGFYKLQAIALPDISEQESIERGIELLEKAAREVAREFRQ